MMIPLNDYIIVKCKEQESECDGLVVVDTAKKKPYTGYVVEVSETIKNISKGETVVWPSTLGVEIDIEGSKYVVLKLEDILLKIK